MLCKGLRMTIPEYARLSGVSERALHDIENGHDNPSLKTLEKLLGPFGLQVGVVRPAVADSEPPPRRLTSMTRPTTGQSGHSPATRNTACPDTA